MDSLETFEAMIPWSTPSRSQQHATVAEMWTSQGWNVHLGRNLNDWEVDKLGSFYNTLAPFNHLTGVKDIAIWKVGNKGVFSVNSTYNNLTIPNNKMEQWPRKMIWGTKIPYKVNCFTWQLTSTDTRKHEEEEIPTMLQMLLMWRTTRDSQSSLFTV